MSIRCVRCPDLTSKQCPFCDQPLCGKCNHEYGDCGTSTCPSAVDDNDLEEEYDDDDDDA